MSSELANLQFFVSSSTPILLILMSLLYTANSTSTNTTEAIVKFIISVVVLVVSPYISGPLLCVDDHSGGGLSCLYNTCSSLSVLFVIIVIAMFVIKP